MEAAHIEPKHATVNIIRGLERLPPRKPDGQKGDYGRILVVGGRRGMAGAPSLAGMAALRGGAGLVTVATPESCLSTVASFYPELMTEPLPETDAQTISLRSFDYGRFDSLLDGKTVLAIGPGISQHPETQESPNHPAGVRFG